MRVLVLVLLALVVVACGNDKSPGGDAATATDTRVTPDAPDDSTTAATDVAATEVAATETVAEVVEDTAADVVPDQTVCSAAGPVTLACVDEANLRATLAAIAGPRAPGDAKHAVASALCKTTFTELGFTVTEQPATQGTNIIGVRTGTSKPDELVVVGAHYDGVPGCDAADDNGSGVAGLLEVARVLRARDHARTLVVVCWDTEEDGLIGSQSHAAALAADQADVAMAFDFEMIGFTNDAPNSQQFPAGFELIFPEAAEALAARQNRGDFIALIVGDDAPGPTAAMSAAAAAIALPAIPIVLNAALRETPVLADLRRSDHAAFWARGYPAVMITDSANFRNPYYHCAGGEDAVSTLDFTFMRKVAAMTASAAEVTLDAADRGTARPTP